MYGGEEGKGEEDDRVRSLRERNFVLGGTSGRGAVTASLMVDCLCGLLVKVMVICWSTISDWEASEGVLEGLKFSL